MTDSQTKQRPPHGGRLEDRVVCISLASVRLANAGQELDETPTGLISLALRLTAVRCQGSHTRSWSVAPVRTEHTTTSIK